MSTKRNVQKSALEMDSGYESPDDTEDIEMDEKENKIFRLKVATEKIEFFLNRKATNWYCGRCKRYIKTYELHYRCFDCVNYSCCVECYKFLKSKKRLHLHSKISYFAPQKGPYFEFIKKMYEDEDMTLHTLLSTCFREYASRYYVGCRKSTKEKQISYMTYSQVERECCNLLHGMKVKLKIDRKIDRIGIISDINIDYVLIYFTCLMGGIIFIPIQGVLSEEEKEHVIKKSEATTITYSSKYSKEVKNLKKNCKNIKNVVLMDNNQTQESLTITSLIESGKRVEVKKFPKIQYEKYNDNDIVTLIFSSGTTGFPKGICFRHKSFMRDVIMRMNLVFPLIRNVFLPFSNKSGMYSIFITFFNGGRMCTLTNSDMANLFKDFALVRPTVASFVPRIFQHVYNEFHEQCKNEDRKKVASKMENIFGNRLTDLAVGSAKSSNKLKRFIRRLTRLPLVDGYGLSELGGVLIDWKIDENKNKYKIVDCIDLGYTNEDKPWPRGELCIKNLLSKSIEYYKEKELTDSKIDKDGYFHTGDIVRIEKTKDGEKRIIIIDRKCNVLKLSQGIFISLESVESTLETSKLIDQLLLFPDKQNNKLFAIVVPNEVENALKKEEIIKDLISIGKLNNLEIWKLPKDLILSKEKFEVTELRKKKRKKILQKFERQIHALLQKNAMETEVANVLNIKEFNLNSSKSFKELGGDSLSGVMLLKKMNSKGFKITYEDLMNKPLNDLSRTNDILDIKEKKMEFVSYSKENFQLKKLIEQMNVQHPIKKHLKMKNIFVTGATGYVGNCLMNELLSKLKDSTFHCLIRTNSLHKAKSLRNNKRVIVVEGDLSKHHFGLSPEKFKKLTSRIDCIVHCGAMINHFLSVNDHYNANIRSLFDIVEISSGYKPIVYISTVSVFANVKKSLLTQKHKKKNGYSGSKWVCDCLIKTLLKNFLIIRLPLIFGDRKTNKVNHSDWLCRILKSIVEFNIAPSENVHYPLNMIHADFLCESIVRLMHLKVFNGREVNFSFANSSLSQLISYVQKWKKEKGNKTKLECLSFQGWLKKLEEESLNRERNYMLPFIHRFKLANKVGSRTICSFNRELFFKHFEKRCNVLSYRTFKKLIESICKE